MSLKVKVEDFEEFTEFNDASFNLTDSIDIAKKIAEKLWEEQKLLYSDFSDNQWKFLNNMYHYTHFDFEEILNIVKFYHHIDEQEFIQVVKCWIATNLEALSVSTVKQSLTNLKDILTLSYGFLYDAELIADVGEKLVEMDKQKRYALSICVLNFIQFYEDIDPKGLYGQMLRKVKDTVPYTELENVRILPSTKDLIFFNSIITDYFDQISIEDPNYYRFFQFLYGGN